ncbi:class I SAM-dependent methyltransferase [Priestia taiwanensis]|nr:class I SAM-dependent methyltransferase [Priestia taiwanensis]
MERTDVETLFSTIDEATLLLKKQLGYSYLEALVESGENMFQGEVLQEGVFDSVKERLEASVKAFAEIEYKTEDIRRAFQLCLLKGMKEGIQPHHEMTPDAVALFVSYLFNKFTQEKKELSLLDPAVGTGNLVTAILNNAEGKEVTGYGVDADELLLRLAFVNANLQKHGIELFNGDSLGSLYIDPVDAIVCDLPVGHYPNEERAATYRLKANNGMSYTHHLFIEQCAHHIKEGGYMFLLIPNFMFEGEEAKSLHEFINETCYIQGLLQLPVSMFKNDRHAKSIFVLQKKGAGAKAPKQVLLAELPSFTNMAAMEKMMVQMNNWFDTEFAKR